MFLFILLIICLVIKSCHLEIKITYFSFLNIDYSIFYYLDLIEESSVIPLAWTLSLWVTCSTSVAKTTKPLDLQIGSSQMK